jgi:serine/threonine-protein kinase HipA
MTTVEVLMDDAERTRLVGQAHFTRQRRIATALAGWRKHARKNQIGENEIAMMAESLESRLEAVTKAA